VAIPRFDDVGLGPFGRIRTFLRVTWRARARFLSFFLCLALLPWLAADAEPAPTARAGCPPIAPKIKPGSTRIGLNVDTMDRTFTQEMAVRRQVYGRQPVIRVWDNGVPPWNAWKTRTPTLSPHTAVVTSFEMPPAQVLSGRYDAALLHFFRTAPRGHKIYWNYRHEPELRVQARQFTASQYRAAWRHIATLSGRACRPNLVPTLVLMQWTADPRSGDSWRNYYPGSRYVSVIAWDAYPGRTDRVPSSYRTPARLYDAVVRASAAAHKPWAIAETGSPLVPGDSSGAARAAWLTRIAAYARAHHALWMTYFDFNSRIDFRLRDRASISAWRAAMHPRG
jgi:hypothetical protein